MEREVAAKAATIPMARIDDFFIVCGGCSLRSRGGGQKELFRLTVFWFVGQRQPTGYLRSTSSNLGADSSAAAASFKLNLAQICSNSVTAAGRASVVSPDLPLN
jgi:hypothetical protein